ncbi:glycoside hydrolase family 99-like domain-containing protein [Dyella sp. KRB-257]|uniref:glycoside hydrolase family 99-like domain-containing protein n=1 Tax=Dyella sp. KRB-257 TaxID=3400915 RepID=UPI003C02095F
MPLPNALRSPLYSLLRSGFRLLPLPTAVRDRWRQRFLDRLAGLVPPGPRGQPASADAPLRRPRHHAGGRALGYREHSVVALPDPLPATVVAFYLPQFHPIPENDAWWGEGFTEWHNVTRALPQFEGHVQPRLPGSLGFYDLRLPDAMRRQMQLAREYGIGAFCSYFYWFAGKTLLEQPLRQWLDDPALDLPICLCWANENWSRRWDGRADQVLIAQRHSAQDDLAFIAHVAPYLRDPRYLRVDGKPLLLVYRPGLLPEPRNTAQRWRRWCREHGIGDIHLVYVQSFDNVDPADIGFDAAVAFPPNNITPRPITDRFRLINPDFHGDIHDWRELAAADPPRARFPLYPTVNPGWDNEPRRSGRGRVFMHASPRAYGEWLRRSIAHAGTTQPAGRPPLVFVNAWNEWAEGAVLEPDARLGHAWLHATRAAMLPQAARDTRPCVVIHAWYPEVLGEMLDRLIASKLDWRLIVTTTPDKAEAVLQAMTRARIDGEIVTSENRGRDILPFLRLADRLLDEGVEVVLKLHTKRSVHRQDGETWRRELLDGLLAPQRAQRIFEAFGEDAALGLVAADGHIQPLHYYWGANRHHVEYLAARLGLAQPDVEHDRFIAGSMFWMRLDALRPLFDAHLGIDEFEIEVNQVDGTLAHAIERIFLLAAHHGGYRTETAGQLCGEAPPDDRAFPYARRD